MKDISRPENKHYWDQIADKYELQRTPAPGIFTRVQDSMTAASQAKRQTSSGANSQSTLVNEDAFATKMHHLRSQRCRKKHSNLIGINGTVNNKSSFTTYSQNMTQKRINQIATIKKHLLGRGRTESIELMKMNNHSFQPKTSSTQLMDPLHWLSRSIDFDNNQLLQFFFADCLPSRKASRSALACHQVLNLSALLHCIQLASAATTRACNARSVFVSNRIVPQSKGAWIK